MQSVILKIETQKLASFDRFFSFHKVMVTLVKLWENTTVETLVLGRAFTVFLDRLNFHSCYQNFMESVFYILNMR